VFENKPPAKICGPNNDEVRPPKIPKNKKKNMKPKIQKTKTPKNSRKKPENSKETKT
jgi:hypothetical protein